MDTENPLNPWDAHLAAMLGELSDERFAVVAERAGRDRSIEFEIRRKVPR